MKLYLASFLQKQNFGPGRLISITENGRPNGVSVSALFKPFTPPKALVDSYNEMRPSQPKEAADMFVSSYKAQLESFIVEAKDDAEKEGKTIIELLPFEDGDTLASWERAEFTNYRKILAPYLEKIGFEIVLN